MANGDTHLLSIEREFFNSPKSKEPLYLENHQNLSKMEVNLAHSVRDIICNILSNMY